jgi:hypothetical protein
MRTITSSKTGIIIFPNKVKEFWQCQLVIIYNNEMLSAQKETFLKCALTVVSHAPCSELLWMMGN